MCQVLIVLNTWMYCCLSSHQKIIEFFISLFSLAFTTAIEIHCQSGCHLSYIMAPGIKHNAFRVICLCSSEFHCILNGELIITLFSSLSQCSEEYFRKLKGRQKTISLFNDTLSTNSFFF